VSLEGVDSSSRICQNCGERVFRAARAPGYVWSGPQNIYRVEQHDTLGKLARRITREVEWFTPWGAEQSASTSRNEGPLDMFRVPRMFGIGEARDGTLWAHVWGLFDTRPEDVKIDPNDPTSQSRVYNAIRARVEAIDPSRNEVLGMIEFPSLTVPVSGDLSAILNVDEAGDWTWKIVRLRVQR
jgi:hypothetical protein